MEKSTDRTAQATGVGKNIVCKMKSHRDLDDWSDDHEDRRERPMIVPLKWAGVVRGCIRDMFLIDKRMPTT